MRYLLPLAASALCAIVVGARASLSSVRGASVARTSSSFSRSRPVHRNPTHRSSFGNVKTPSNPRVNSYPQRAIGAQSQIRPRSSIGSASDIGSVLPAAAAGLSLSLLANAAVERARANALIYPNSNRRIGNVRSRTDRIGQNRPMQFENKLNTTVTVSCSGATSFQRQLAAGERQRLQTARNLHCQVTSDDQSCAMPDLLGAEAVMVEIRSDGVFKSGNVSLCSWNTENTLE